MQWVLDNWLQIFAAILAVHAAASAIAALTPTPKDDEILKKIKGWINVLALNVGNAKNKE